MRIERLAPWYRWIEYCAFGRALERQRFAFLPAITAARHVLILGEGDGRFLARSLETAPGAHFDVVEVSSEMIALSRRRTGNPERVAYHCRDARDMPYPPGHYDAIVTNFFLDCFTEDEARRIIGCLAESLTANGLWLLSEFEIPERGWQRLHAHVWVWIMYRFFRATTGLSAIALPPVDGLLRAAALRRIARQEERVGLIVSEIWHRADSPDVTTL